MAKAILEGHWTNEPPVWCHDSSHYRLHTCASTDYTRAVQTAEAFLQLFKEYNPRFDQQRFLVACGLVDAPPVKTKRSVKVAAKCRYCGAYSDWDDLTVGGCIKGAN